MVEVICDTSFLIHVANTRIKNAQRVEVEIGDLEYAIPAAVLDELERLGRDERKGARARAALEYVSGMKRVEICGEIADDAIVKHIMENGGIVATMDRNLKRRIKELGCCVISVANETIVVEP